jgi:uncharacterized membrane protein YbhN (UPF0104 family)
MVKKQLKIIIRLIISCLLVIYLASHIDWHPIISALREVDLLYYILSTCTALIAVFIVACKYFLLIQNTPLHHSIWSLTKINFMSRFYATFLPTALGSELVRWYKVTHFQRGKLLFLTASLYERLSFLAVLLLFGFVPLCFHTSYIGIIALREKLFPIMIPAFAATGLLLAIFIFPGVQPYIVSLAKRLISRIFPKRNQNWDSLYMPPDHNKKLLYFCVFGLSLVWQFLFLARMILLFNATHIQLAVVDIAWMGSLVLLLQIVPLSLAGIGVREGAYAYLFTLFNLAPEAGVLIGILFFSQMLIMALAGGVLELTDR